MQAISQRDFGGGEPATFAQLYFKRDGLTVMLRQQDLAGMVRSPLNAAEARRLLKHLADWDGRMSKEWKARTRANQARIEKGDPFGCAEVYKGLMKLDAAGALVAADRIHLTLATELLTEEISSALGKTPEEVGAMIVARCGLTTDGDIDP